MTRPRHNRPINRSGFTLAEVMIAAVVAAIALLALLGTAFIAYKINQKARLRDNARAVLRTYIDQFQRLDYADQQDPPVVRMLFTPTTGDTGLGLRWGQLSDQINYAGAPTALTIDIGPPGSPQTATITRNVSFINSSTGNGSSTSVSDAAGIMMRATFTVSYSLAGTNENVITQSMSTLRLVP